MKPLSYFRLFLCVALTLAVAAVGSFATAPKIPTWYAGLAKPAFTPPNAVFPIAWTILYVLMAVALWRLWDRNAPSPQRRTALILFFVQLALNALWSPVFFEMEAIGPGLVVILLLWVTIAATIWASARIDRIAAWLLAPYLLWVSYASVLNATILAMN